MNIFPNLLLNTKLNPMLNIETGVRRKKFILGGVNLIYEVLKNYTAFVLQYKALLFRHTPPFLGCLPYNKHLQSVQPLLSDTIARRAYPAQSDMVYELA